MMSFKSYLGVNKKVERWPSSITTSKKNFEEVKEIFPITADVKKMHEMWNKLIVLIFLGVDFSKARPNVIDSSTVKSLEDTYHFLREAVPSESQNPRSFCSCSRRQNNKR